MSTYSYVGDTLLLDDAAVLVVPGATPGEMEALVARYQASMDAPKINPDLEIHQRSGKRNIDALREAELLRGVEWNGLTWYADSQFQVQLTAYIVAFLSGVLPTGATVTVRAMDTSTHELTFDDLKALAGVLLPKVQTAFVTSWNRKAEVESKKLRDFDKVPFQAP